MITVKISDQSDLQIPRRLSNELSLSDGDRVKLVRHGDVVILQKVEKAPPKSLQSLAGMVKSSRPRGSVDVTDPMDRKGYESFRDPHDP